MKFSLRTLFLTTTATAIFLGIFATRQYYPLAPILTHLIIVIAFAIPGGSFGYDVGQTPDAAAFGTLIAAVAGTILSAAAVLVTDQLRLFP